MLLTHDVVGLKVREGSVAVVTGDVTEISATSPIIATGVSYRRLDVPGADDLTGRGVYHGAAEVDAVALAGDDAFVVGGAISAGQAAISFADRVKSVTLLIRSGSLSATTSNYPIERIERTPNIRLRFHTTVEAVIGAEHLGEIVPKDSSGGETETVSADALFVFIGAQPRTDWPAGRVARDSPSPAPTCRRTSAAPPGPSTGNRISSKRTSPASSPSAMSATAPANASPPPSAKARWPSWPSSNNGRTRGSKGRPETSVS